MNKTELVAAIAKKTELSKKDAEKALKAFTDVVAEASSACSRSNIFSLLSAARMLFSRLNCLSFSMLLSTCLMRRVAVL